MSPDDDDRVTWIRGASKDRYLPDGARPLLTLTLVISHRSPLLARAGDKMLF